MKDRTTREVWVLLSVVLLASSVVLSSCDLSAAGNTAILNAESTIPPTVQYEFRYGPSEVTNAGQVAVVSEGSDDLGNVLSQNGFRRSDVVSARIDSVTVERLSAPTFAYLTGADVHLGGSASDPRIATGGFSTSAETARLNVATQTVTGIVKEGQTEAFAQFDTNDPDRVPPNDAVQVTVYFRLEVEGV